MVLVRFCARAMLQQLYRRDFVEGTSPGEWVGGWVGGRMRFIMCRVCEL